MTATCPTSLAFTLTWCAIKRPWGLLHKRERERERERWGGVHAAPKKDSTGEHGLPWKIKYLLLTLKPMEKANGETSPRERVHTYILVYSSKTLLLLFFFSKFFHFLKPILNVSCSVLMKDIRENYSLKMQV